MRAQRCLDDLDVDGDECGVEGSGELAVAVVNQEPEAPVDVVEVHEQVADHLREPRSGGVRGDAEDVDAACGVVDDEERVEPVQRVRVEVEQVARQDGLGPARGGIGTRSARSAATPGSCSARRRWASICGLWGSFCGSSLLIGEIRQRAVVARIGEHELVFGHIRGRPTPLVSPRPARRDALLHWRV